MSLAFALLLPFHGANGSAVHCFADSYAACPLDGDVTPLQDGTPNPVCRTPGALRLCFEGVCQLAL